MRVRMPSAGMSSRSARRIRRYAGTSFAGVLSAVLFSVGLEGQVEQWEVAGEPELSIGSIDGANNDLFVNVLMGTELSDGTIVVRNSSRGTFELRYFDSRGRHLTTASRWGQGPYEFHVPAGSFRLPGDSIFVAGDDDRFAVFGPRGQGVRDGRMGTLRDPPHFVYALDSGHLVFRKQASRGDADPWAPESGRTSQYVVTFDLTTQQFDTVATIAGEFTHYELETNAIFPFSAPFGSMGHVAVGGGRIWIGDSSDPVIRGYRIGESDPSASIRIPANPRAVTRADRAAYDDAAARRFTGDMAPYWNRASGSLSFPDVMPLYHEIHVDRLGNVWVREYMPPWEGGAWSWMVFSPAGEHVANVDVPEPALPYCARRFSGHCDAFLEAGEDYVLVAQRDEWGVPYLRKYALRKP